MACDAKIRPFPNDSVVVCELNDHADNHGAHRGVLRDYAYPGSETFITWFEDDRRTYHGEWPGACTSCGAHEARLPRGHAGRHV